MKLTCPVCEAVYNDAERSREPGYRDGCKMYEKFKDQVR